MKILEEARAALKPPTGSPSDARVQDSSPPGDPEDPDSIHVVQIEAEPAGIQMKIPPVKPPRTWIRKAVTFSLRDSAEENIVPTSLSTDV